MGYSFVLTTIGLLWCLIQNYCADLDGTNESKVCLIECHFQIKGTGTLKLSAESETNDLSFTGNGKYGLRPDQLKFGNDKIIKLTTDSNVESYLLITEFRRK